MKLSVMLPTWKRPKKLILALESLIRQERQPDEVVTVYRDIDLEAKEIIEQFKDKLPLNIVEVTIPGVIAAENAALKASTGDIICFLDDDAEAPTHWLKLIEKHFLDNKNLGGVGGPDLITEHDDPNYRKIVSTVGKVLPYGKIIGNHHHMTESILKVDVLKGVNMSFRKSVFPFLDHRLQSNHNEGNGSHWELDVCLQIKKAGHELIFDPQLDVRHNSNHSHFIINKNTKNNSRNLTYVILKNFNFQHKIIFLIYILLIGNTQIIGVGKFLQLCFKIGPFKAINDYFFSTLGLFQGLKIYMTT